MTRPNRFEPYPLELVHRLMEPGPTILISTADMGRANLMTNGFNMAVAHGGLIGVVVGPWDYSFSALEHTRECVIGVPGAPLLPTVVDIGNCSGAHMDKWEHFGLTAVPASQVGPPLIGECFANIECSVADDRLVEDHGLWLLQADAAWIYESGRGNGELHHRGNGTFSTNGELIDMRERMSMWRHWTEDPED